MEARLTIPPPPTPPRAAAALAVAEAATQRRARVDRQVDDERVTTLYELTATPLVAGVAFAILVAVILWPYRPGVVVAGWLAAKLFIAALRMRDVIRFKRTAGHTRDVATWKRRAVALLAIDGICWGTMGLIFMPDEAPGVQAVIIASLIGIAGSGVFSFISLARGCILFLCGLLLPSIVYQLTRGTDAGWFAALGMVIYFVLMCIEARRGEARVIEMLRLRFENALIAEERHRAMLLAEHSSAAKSRFLATVSHEVRTPLNGIMGMAQLLQRSSVTPEQMAQLATLCDSARHLQTVIGDLLDLSRIEFGKLALDDRVFVLDDTVREVTGLQHALAQEKGLRFDVEFAPGLPARMVGDASRIKQVLHNLIGNAIKFTAQGQVAVRVDAVAGRLRFAVRDSGKGIAPEVLESLFDAFEQGPAATLHARSGTGLGLTISRKIARAMGGDVVYESTGTHGAAFVFSLPLRPASAHAVAAPPSAVAPPPAPIFSGHVLIVDDNPVNALVASAMLERMGLQTDSAEDGAQALALMRTRCYDLVLMDCQLPVLDGWEATRRWRMAEDASHRLPIVALTANAVAGDRERCLAAGMDDYLAKPFEMGDLANIVERQLARASAPRAA